MTPLHLRLLLHYYAINEPYAVNDPRHAQSAATLAYTADLVSKGLISPEATSKSGYRSTARGDAFVNHICALPLPEQVWRMPLCAPQEQQHGG